MPQLLLFAPCERVARDLDGGICLINILHGVQVQEPPSNDLDSDEAAPLRWAMVAIWQRQGEDAETTFEQRIQIVKPDGSTVGGSQITFNIPQKTHFNAIRGDAFPVAQTGIYHLRLSLRDATTKGRWKKIAEYPIEVEYITRQEGGTDAEA